MFTSSALKQASAIKTLQQDLSWVLNPYAAHCHQPQCSAPVPWGTSGAAVSDQTALQARPKEENTRSLCYSQGSTGCWCGQCLCRDNPFWTTHAGSVGSSNKPISSAHNSLTPNPNFLIPSALPTAQRHMYNQC